MTKKDLSEIRRRFNPERHNITCIRGCYVNGQGQPIATFSHAPVNLRKEDAEKYFSIFRRTLSGELDQNLVAINFPPEQVMNGREHALLMALRDCALQDDELVDAFFEQAAAGLPQIPDQHHLILLAHDGYDLARRNKAGEKDPDASDEVFHYLLCSVCPVKLTKPALTYEPRENDFTSSEGDWTVSMPETGFLFPCFEERAADIYAALSYTRDTAAPYAGLIPALFGVDAPLPAALQKEAFQTMLQDTLGEDCSLEVMQAVQEQVMDKITVQKEEKLPDPPRLEKREVVSALNDCGVPPEKQAAFSEEFDRQFGETAAVHVGSLMSPRQFQVKTPSVTISVAPDRSDLLQTRIIDGHPYILIRAEEGVAVNGVEVSIR